MNNSPKHLSIFARFTKWLNYFIKQLLGLPPEASLKETFGAIIWIGTLVIGIRVFIFEPFTIPSGSMHPQLWEGDLIFVLKSKYGYSRHSLPFGLNLFSGRIWFTPPERGDVIVFKCPDFVTRKGPVNWEKIDTFYIKRVIGLPGDRIQMREGVLYVNDKPVKMERTTDYEMALWDEPKQIVECYNETFPEAMSQDSDQQVAHKVICADGKGNNRYDDTPVMLVPPGHYFAMGDNRHRSADSRVLTQIGFIPEEQLVGKAVMIFFSTDGSAKWWQFWRWPLVIRYNRIGTMIK